MPEIALADLPEVYSFCDPAGSKNRSQALRKVGARSALVTIGVDPFGRIFVLESWADRCRTSTLVEKIFATAARWRPRIFGVEANAMQALAVETMQLIAEIQQRRVSLAPIKQPTGIDKEARIKMAIDPVMRSGRLILAGTHPELEEELLVFPRGRTCDLVDALASAINLAPPRRPARRSSKVAADLARYLRDRGASPTYIEDRIAALSRREALAGTTRPG